jgi:hypothetical protein
MTLSKLEEFFSIGVMTSWIKLPVIMHANKIGAKKRNNLSWKSLEFWLEYLVFLEIHTKVTSSQTIKRYTQNQSLKWIQRTMEKAILILQRVNFCFQNTRQSNDCMYWMTCVGSLTKKLDFQNIFSKTDIFLISFQQLDLNRHDFWNMRFDSRTRKIVKQEEHRSSLQNPR